MFKLNAFKIFVNLVLLGFLCACIYSFITVASSNTQVVEIKNVVEENVISSESTNTIQENGVIENIVIENVVEEKEFETPVAKKKTTTKTTSRSSTPKVQETKTEEAKTEPTETIKFSIKDEILDWSCHEQDGGYLQSNNLCIWVGKGKPNDNQGTYYCAHSNTSWGRKINGLKIGDVIEISGVKYKITKAVKIPKYGDRGSYADATIDKCFNYSGDVAYLQTCINDTQMIIKEAHPVD